LQINEKSYLASILKMSSLKLNNSLTVKPTILSDLVHREEESLERQILAEN